MASTIASGDTHSNGAPADIKARLIRRVSMFVNYALIPALAFSAMQVAGAYAFNDYRLGLAGLITLAYGGCLWWARNELKNGNIVRAVMIASIGLLALAGAEAPLVPIGLPATIILPLTAVTLALPYVTGRQIRALLVLAGLVGMVALAIEATYAPENDLPRWFAVGFRYVTAVTALGFTLLVLGHFTFRLNESLAETLSMNREVELRRAELQESEERFRQIAENIREVFYISDLRQPKMLYISPAYEEVWGRTTESLRNNPMSFIDAVQPEHRARVMRSLEQHSAGENTEMEYSIARPDGSIRWIRDRSYPLRDAQGTVYRVIGIAEDITERKNNRRIIQEREATFRLLFAGHPHPMWVYDIDTLEFLEVNNAAVAKYGYRRGEFLRLRLTDIRPEDDVPALMENLAKRRPVLQHSGPWRHKLKNGDIIFVEISSHALNFAGHNAALVVAQDVTARLAAEEALRKAAEEIRDLFNNAPCGYHSLDSDGIFVQINDTELGWLGYERHAVVGRLKFFDLLTPEGKAQFAKHFSQFKQSGIARDLEFDVVRKDGTLMPVVVSATAVKDANGRYLMSRSTVNDNTERKQAQRAAAQLLALERSARAEVEAAQRRLAFLLEASSALAESFDYAWRLELLAQLIVKEVADWCAIHLTGDDGQLQMVAVAHRSADKVRLAKELNNEYPPDPSLPTSPQAVIRTGQPILIREIAPALLASVAVDERHLDLLTQLGLRSAMSVPLKARDEAFGTISFVNAESGRPFTDADLSLAQDLARRAAMLIDNAKLYQHTQQINVQLEQRVAERTEQLEAANRELESFSYSVSHDLRAPLRHISGFVELLQGRSEGIDAQGKRYLEIISDSAERMGKLIDNLLDFSRMARVEMQVAAVDLFRLFNEALQELQPDYAGRKVACHIRPLPAVKGDAAMLKLVALNLLSNAIKYSRIREEAVITVSGDTQNNEHLISVQDNGIGFNMKYVGKLFGVFQRLHSAKEFEGTGIGLANVQRIIARHGGRVWVHSESGVGATFYFALPTTHAERSVQDDRH